MGWSSCCHQHLPYHMHIVVIAATATAAATAAAAATAGGFVQDLKVTGVDPNVEMLPHLQGVAEELPLPDSSQDVVISTLVSFVQASPSRLRTCNQSSTCSLLCTFSCLDNGAANKMEIVAERYARLCPVQVCLLLLMLSALLLYCCPLLCNAGDDVHGAEPCIPNKPNTPDPPGTCACWTLLKVLCSVADPRAALSEVLRVLKPGGSFLFMEHVAAPLGSWPRTLQELVNPAWEWIADGCHVNRETWVAIESAGFGCCDLQHFSASSNPLFVLLAPHISGRAVK
eukprot:gene10569-biopygen12481